ncbi:MAG TPA: hypothetical protein VN445_15055 [Rectinemataceae bacterium]|nr:hypothetical protein [Rectinemataceae bacterium]
MIFWNAELTKRLACTDKEKAALPSIVQGLLAISDRVRDEGILPLASAEQTASQPEMLRYGFRLITEGLSTEVLEEILAIYLTTSGLSGFEFLKQCVYVEALLSIAAGDSRDLLLRKLVPYCGAEKAFSLLKALDAADSPKAL